MFPVGVTQSMPIASPQACAQLGNAKCDVNVLNFKAMLGVGTR